MGPHQLVVAHLRFTKLSIAVDLLKNVPPSGREKDILHFWSITQTYALVIPLVWFFFIFWMRSRLECFSILVP